jgi:hypothetical protein
MTTRLSALALVGALAFAAPAIAEEAASPTDLTDQRITLETATNLVNYGRAKSDALAIMTGVKMMAGIPARVEGMDLEALLGEAEAMAGGNEALMSIAAEVRDELAEGDRGLCYWEYYCYWNGYCEYLWWCM